MSTKAISGSFEGTLQWEPRRRMTLNAARRRSLLVKILRFTFVLMAVLIVSVVAAYIVVGSNRPVPVVSLMPVQVANENEMVIQKPVFTGRDDSKNPFSLSADTALQQTDGSGITNLVNPELNTSPEKNGGANVTARHGQYDDTGRVLELTDEVTLTTDSGFEYTTPNATIDLSSDIISGDNGVQGEGPLGNIKSDEFKIVEGGERVYFTGRVVTRINIGTDKKDKKKEDEE
ncbi:MAG: LPS export ABC transporter periplasmic protein LptC [Robiginitomaculum sp.]|nr:LPS export ABC transporter periplasmic protein LptC [Robiginitomaculum sp.]